MEQGPVSNAKGNTTSCAAGVQGTRFLAALTSSSSLSALALLACSCPSRAARCCLHLRASSSWVVVCRWATCAVCCWNTTLSCRWCSACTPLVKHQTQNRMLNQDGAVYCKAQYNLVLPAMATDANGALERQGPALHIVSSAMSQRTLQGYSGSYITGLQHYLHYRVTGVVALQCYSVAYLQAG